MIIEEQIEQAAREYATHWIDTKETDFYGKFIQEKGCNRDEERGFIAGARWAVNNSKLSWISVKDDLPCNHDELLNPDNKRDTSCVVAIIHGHIVLSRMYKLYGKWYWENNEPTHWFPIPKLP